MKAKILEILKKHQKEECDDESSYFVIFGGEFESLADDILELILWEVKDALK